MSWTLGMAIVGAISLVVLALLRRVQRRWLRGVIALLVPVFIAGALYWGLVCATGSSDDPEFAAWAGFIIVTWAVAGYVAMGLGALVWVAIRAIRKSRG